MKQRIRFTGQSQVTMQRNWVYSGSSSWWISIVGADLYDGVGIVINVGLGASAKEILSECSEVLNTNCGFKSQSLAPILRQLIVDNEINHAVWEFDCEPCADDLRDSGKWRTLKTVDDVLDLLRAVETTE